MTRIIAGFAGSLPLAVPRSGTRPTSDRVREALFSALEARDLIAGARVVDLYAGSGALGLEAASRGAASVTVVERAAAAAAVCRRNRRDLLAAAQRAHRGGAPHPAPPTIDVEAVSVAAFLARAADHEPAPTWDLAFVDPPYDLDDAALGTALEALTPLLSGEAVVIVERSSRSSEPAWPHGLERERRSAYGETVLWWARRA